MDDVAAYRVTIVCGAGETEFSTPLIRDSVEESVLWVLREAARQFGGATLTRTSGSWLSPVSGDTVIEPGLKLEIMLNGERESLVSGIRQFAAAFRDRFQQHEVMCTIEGPIGFQLL